MKLHINRVILVKPLGDIDGHERYGRYLIDRHIKNHECKTYEPKKCTISNDFSVDLGDAVGGSVTTPVECAGDGDDGDSGDGDPESDRRKLKSQKLSYIYKTPPQYQLPKEGFVRLRHILQVLPIGKSTWWAGVRSGRYPQPVRTLGQRITAWRVEDIHNLIKNAA